MPQYVLLLPGGDFEGVSANDMQKISEDYLSWVDALKKTGRYKRAAHLLDTGRILHKEIDRIVDGPFTETKEAIGGYYQLEAKNYEEAVELAKTCPHLKYGGVIEIREVMEHQEE